jgi:hypothetical protein
MGRVFALLDDADGTDQTARVRAFELILILVVGTEYWLRAVPKWGQLTPAYYGHLAVATLCCLAALRVPWRRAAFAVLAVSHAGLVWREFPSAGNHAYLEVFFCALAAFLRTSDPAEARLFVRAVRWMVVIIFFYSGLQKWVHGYWVHGQYLAFSLDSAGFRPVLRLLLSPAEYARLAALTGEVGDGSYRVTSWLLLAVSNATWLVEMALAPLLVWRRTRLPAAVVGLALLTGIEVGAREVFFGLIFVNAALCFLPVGLHRRAVPMVAVVLLALTLSRLGVLPEATFF